jgi:hypothetical protein
MGVVAIGAILLAVLLAVGAAMMWQEARRPGRPEQALYLVDEAVEFVAARLREPVSGRITVADVRSMLEWSTYHSQVVVARSGASIPVLGGPEAVAFICRQSEERGLGWRSEDVAAVVDLEAAYLVSIGAVGEIVEEEAS